MIRKTFVIPVTAGLMALAGPIGAQEASNTDDTQRWGPLDTRDDALLRDVEDMDVRDVDGEKIGEIEGILVDENGQPAAFHIEVGGFLDIGDEDVSVPLDALTYEEGGYVSKMTRQQLENLPEWDG